MGVVRIKRCVVLDYPYSNALFVGADRTLYPKEHKKAQQWAKQGSRYYKNFLEVVNNRLIQDTYQILLLFDKIIIGPADFPVNKDLKRMKFVEMEYPLQRGIILRPNTGRWGDSLVPLFVSMKRSLREKIPVPIFAEQNQLIHRFSSALNKIVKPPEIKTLGRYASVERRVLNLVLDRVVPRVKVADFNHLLELREDPNLEPFREKIWEFVQILNMEPKKEAIERINSEIDQAIKSVKLPCYGIGDKLKTYSSVAIDLGQLEPHIGPALGAVDLAKDLKEAIDTSKMAKYRWILFGRTRLRRY